MFYLPQLHLSLWSTFLVTITLLMSSCVLYEEAPPYQPSKCLKNQRVQGTLCVDCPSGTRKEAGDNPNGPDTVCNPILCRENERVDANECIPCSTGRNNAAGDDASKEDTTCDLVLCKENQRVLSNMCASCPVGQTNKPGDDTSGEDTTCDVLLCDTNQRVQANGCVNCPAGTTNLAGDSATGADTLCDPVLCKKDEYVQNNACVACPTGSTNEVGDDASGEDTQCDVTYIDAFDLGFTHTCAITSIGDVRCWGNNRSGQLGNGTNLSSSTPVVVRNLGFKTKQIVAGNSHTCALSVEGEVKCWGSNLTGQVGDGTLTSKTEPVSVKGLPTNVTQITAGSEYTCALLQSKQIMCWGDNSFGQLGDGTTTQSSTPVSVSTATPNVVSISAGSGHICSLDAESKLSCWGDNSSGQLGDGTTEQRLTPVMLTKPSDVVKVSLGQTHTCIADNKGAISCWGSGFLGKADVSRILQLDSEPIDLGDQAIQVSTKKEHTCVTLASGNIKCWGDNEYGQLGDGTNETRRTPVQNLDESANFINVKTGGLHSCALDNTGNLKCWGDNTNGQLGNGKRVNIFVPEEFSRLSGVQDISCSIVHSCSISSGNLKCWGDNTNGQLGNGTTTDSSVPLDPFGLLKPISKVTTSRTHTCAIDTDGNVKCWGSNTFGELGNGNTTPQPTPVSVASLSGKAIDVGTGLGFSCALLEDQTIKCWGNNSFGQLGGSSEMQELTPTSISNSDTKFTKLSVGSSHACAITSDGSVVCWGSNAGGELGNNTKQPSTTPIQVPNIGAIVDVKAKRSQTCTLSNTGAIKCWGLRAYGKVEDGKIKDSLVPVNVLGYTKGVTQFDMSLSRICAIVNGGLTCWGTNAFGQIGDGTTETRLQPTQVFGMTKGVLKVQAGSGFTCALLDTGKIYCWGSNRSGVLGDSVAWRSFKPVEVQR